MKISLFLMVFIITTFLFSSPISAWLDNYDYRTPIEINNTGGNLTYYQYNFTIDTATLVSAGKININGSDCRITNNTDVLQEFWNETAFNDSNTKIWVNATELGNITNTTHYMYYGKTGMVSTSDIGAMAYKLGDDFRSAVDYYKFSVDSTNHTDYGLTYPVTYKFNIPPGSANLEAYKKFTVAGSWIQITENTSSDFFNGIEAVRFDYTNNSAFVSIAFDISYDDIFIKIIDTSNISVATYADITEYYDDRDAVVTSSVDDYGHYSGWAGCASYAAANWNTLKDCSNTFAEHKVWYSGGIDINHSAYPESVNWTILQEYLINPGYGEAASHSWKHMDCPYDDYDREMNQSKLVIMDNLTLPYSKGSDEYVYLWIEPGGQTCNRSFLGECKYLVDRSVVNDQNTWASWDATNGLYNRIGRSIEMGECGTEVLATLNAKFDSVTGAGNIYHLVAHHQCVNWAGGSYADQHLDYISNKTNMWYVGFGYMYLYHYIQERGIVTGKAYKNGNEIILTSGGLDSSKWIEELKGTGPSISIVDGECKLNVLDDQTCSASIKSASTFTNGVAIELRRKCPTDNEYIEFSFGSGTVCDVQGGATEWWHTTMHSSYMFYMSSINVNDALLTYIPPTGAKTYLTTWTYINDDANNYHNWTYIYNSSGGLEWYEDNVLKTSTIHNSYLSDNKNILITQGAYSPAGRGAASFLDWVFVRKYATIEPISSVGIEQYPPPEGYVPPDPTNLQNTTGNFWVNQTWQAGGGNITDSYNMSVNNVWYNETINTYWNVTYPYSNNSWQNITIWAYNNTGIGSLSTDSISQNTQLLFTNIPMNLQETHDPIGINWTWGESFLGTHIIDSYNVSINGTWYNGTTNQSYNHTGLDYKLTSSIIIYGYNNTQGLSIYYISDSCTLPTIYKTIKAIKQLVTPIQIIKDKFFNIIPFIISIILFAGFGLAIMVMTSRLKKW